MHIVELNFLRCEYCWHAGLNASNEVWRHGNGCNAILTIDEKGIVRCPNHPKLAAHIMKMQWTCDSGRHVYFVSSVKGLVEAISNSAAVSNVSMQQWFMSVMRSLN